MTLLMIEVASFLVTAVVKAVVRAVGMKPLISRSKVMLLVGELSGANCQHGSEFQVLLKVCGNVEQNLAQGHVYFFY